jgi:hypothetical protein
MPPITTQRRWLLLGIVVLAALATDGTIVCVLRHDPFPEPEWLGIAIFAAVLGQASMLALWAGLGGRPGPWRMTAAIVALGALAGALWSRRDTDEIGFFLFFGYLALTQLLVMSVLLTAGRLWGLELRDVAANDGAAAELGRPWFQFPIRAIMSWTAAVAVLLAVSHYLPLDPFQEIIGDWTVSLAIFTSSALVALGAFWIALGARWSVARYAVLVATTIVGIVWLYVAVREDSALWEFFVFFLTQIVYIAASLWLVRLAGYRLAWRRRVWL